MLTPFWRFIGKNIFFFSFKISYIIQILTNEVNTVKVSELKNVTKNTAAIVAGLRLGYLHA